MVDTVRCALVACGMAAGLLLAVPSSAREAAPTAHAVPVGVAIAKPVPDRAGASTRRRTSAAAVTLAPLEETFRLHSRPTATRVIQLDFDGAFVTGTSWNVEKGLPPAAYLGYSLDGDHTSFTPTERGEIQAIWQAVAEDFAPFDVDVTTEDPGVEAVDRTGGSDVRYGDHVVVSSDRAASVAVCPSSGCSGIAYLGSLTLTQDHLVEQPVWVFQHALVDNTSIANAISHEVGHTAGLLHDGIGEAEYYAGHDVWAPIMGHSLGQPLVQWSRGEYAGATRLEDDLAVLAASFPMVPDEAGDGPSTAVSLAPGGVISSRTDRDTFGLGRCAGAVEVSASVAPAGPDLDLALELLDARGTVLARADPLSARSGFATASGLDATVATTVVDGVHYARVDGVGRGEADTGYTDYGSLGAYTLSVSGCDLAAPDGATPVPPPPPASPGRAAPAGPSAPLEVRTHRGRPGGRLTAVTTWAVPATDGGAAITGYRVTLLELARGRVVGSQEYAGLGAGVRRLSLRLPRGRYAFVVVAVNDAGVGAPSARSRAVRPR